MVENISAFAQWDEQVVDLGKTITLTINGVGSVSFEDYVDFAISILGPVIGKKVNMSPDAFIGRSGSRILKFNSDNLVTYEELNNK